MSNIEISRYESNKDIRSTVTVRDCYEEYKKANALNDMLHWMCMELKDNTGKVYGLGVLVRLRDGLQNVPALKAIVSHMRIPCFVIELTGSYMEQIMRETANNDPSKPADLDAAIRKQIGKSRTEWRDEMNDLIEENKRKFFGDY